MLFGKEKSRSVRRGNIAGKKSVTRQIDGKGAERRGDDDGQDGGGQYDAAAPEPHRERDRAQCGLDGGFRDIGDRAERALLEIQRRANQRQIDACHTEDQGEEDDQRHDAAALLNVTEIHRGAHEHEEHDLGKHPDLLVLFGEARRADRIERVIRDPHRDHCKHGRKGDVFFDGILQGDEEEGKGDHRDDLHGVTRVHVTEKDHEQISDAGAHCDTEHDGDRHLPKDAEIEASSLGHPYEGGEADDHEDVVHRGTGIDHLRHGMQRAVALFLQGDHARDDHSGRDGGDDGADDRTLKDARM